MRDAFTKALFDLAQNDKDIVLITGDLGFGVLRPFWEAYPAQFINAGISEQAMTGMAAGMALSGKKVLTYSIGNFPTLRCLEQIRNDCAYHNANVKIVCVGGGFVYGALGMSHHATEDMAILRALPNVTVFTPGDPEEVRAIVPAMIKHSGTCYLRLGRGGEPLLHTAPIKNYQIGDSILIKEGSDGYILSAGGILSQALSASEILAKSGLFIGVCSFPTIKPIDQARIEALSKKVPYLFTIEEHSIIGGLGSAVCEIIGPMRARKASVIRLGMNDEYASIVGDQQYLRAQYGIDDQGIAGKIKSIINDQA